MGAERREIVHRAHGRAWEFSVAKRPGRIVATVRELEASNGFLTWSPFGGWSCLVDSLPSNRVTQVAVNRLFEARRTEAEREARGRADALGASTQPNGG